MEISIGIQRQAEKRETIIGHNMAGLKRINFSVSKDLAIFGGGAHQLGITSDMPKPRTTSSIPKYMFLIGVRNHVAKAIVMGCIAKSKKSSCFDKGLPKTLESSDHSSKIIQTKMPVGAKLIVRSQYNMRG